MPKKNSFLITGHSPCDPNRVRPSPSRRLRPRESGLWIHCLGLGNQKCARGTGRSAPSNRPLPSMRSGESEVAGFLNPAGEKAQTPVVIPVLCLLMIIDRQSTGITTGVCAFSPAGFKKPATSDSPERMLGRGRLDGADRPVPRAHFWLPKPRQCIQSPDSRGRNRRDGDGRTRLGSQGLWPVIRKEFFLGMVVARQIRWLGKVGHSPE